MTAPDAHARAQALIAEAKGARGLWRTADGELAVSVPGWEDIDTLAAELAAVTERAEEKARQARVLFIDREYERARAETAEEALARVRDNARSWHGPPTGEGHARALAVIAEWCDAVLSARPTEDTAA